MGQRRGVVFVLGSVPRWMLFSPFPKKALVLIGLPLSSLLLGLGWAWNWQPSQRMKSRIAAYSDSIWRHAGNQSLPIELVQAVIRCESSGNPRAVSWKQAKGLMQITAAAERDVLEKLNFPKGDLFDPDYNILIGTAYLRQMLDRFHGDLHLALAAYHAGPTWVDRTLSINPQLSGPELVARQAPPSTRVYCRRIIGNKSIQISLLTSPQVP